MSPTERRAMTIVEILVVMLLVGISIPALTAAISRNAQIAARASARECAVELAQEGSEMLFNGGFYHWWPIVRPPAVNTLSGATYQWSPSGPLPFKPATDVTLIVTATGNSATDDAFNPYVGDKKADRPPWSKYRRQLTLRSRQASSRVLECLVNVWYGPDDANDRITIPVYLVNHPTPQYWRGILWLYSNSLVENMDSTANPPVGQPPEPNTVAQNGPRNAWGGLPGTGSGAPLWATPSTALYESSFPVPKTTAPAGFGYPQ